MAKEREHFLKARRRSWGSKPRMSKFVFPRAHVLCTCPNGYDGSRVGLTCEPGHAGGSRVVVHVGWVAHVTGSGLRRWAPWASHVGFPGQISGSGWHSRVADMGFARGPDQRALGCVVGP